MVVAMKPTHTSSSSASAPLTLVLGANGKTGRRVAERLTALGLPVRRGSRRGVPAFDWHHEAGWDACLSGVSAIYISYVPDLAIPGATDSIQSLVDHAKRAGVRRLVLLSGRGEKEAQACEAIVQASGLEWTIVRASWFNQNFSEGAFLDLVQAGQITLPAGDVKEPFVDADDIAEVATVALAATDERHVGQVYEVTGPELLSFAEVTREIAQATGRALTYQQIPHEAFLGGARESGAPEPVLWILDYLFSTVLDGRNAYLTDGVQRALGRPPKSFATYAREIAATSLWKEAASCPA